MDPASVVARLLGAPLQPGRLVWIGLRLQRRGAVVAVQDAALDPAQGLVGDRYAGRTGTRQVTLIQAEHLPAIGAYLGRTAVTPVQMRRNLVVSGINLLALRGGGIRIGAALLEVTGQCHPCSRMEEELGPGGYNAVRGHGGLTARVVGAGAICVGDGVCRHDAGMPPAP